MASCPFSQFRPLSAAPSTAESSSSSSPASPRTPICKEERLDCTAAADESVAPSVVDEEASSRDNNSEDAAVLSLIERLDDGWFRENVMSCQWRNLFGFSRRRPSTGQLMLWNPSDSSATGEGIRSPDSSASKVGGKKSPSRNGRAASHLSSPFKSIEMVQPLVGFGSSSAERDARDSRDLPRSRLRRLQRRLHADETSFSDGEQKRYPSTRLEGGDGKIESGKARAGARRRREKQAAKFAPAAAPRRFSDGEEPGEDVSAPLANVNEDAVLAEIEGNFSRKSWKSSKPSKNKQNHGSTHVDRPTTKTGKHQQNLDMSLLETNSLPVPAAPRQPRRERRKTSKSLTDAEYDELRGCIDLGFNFSRDDLLPRVVSVIPALKFYKAGEDILNSPNWSSPRGRVSNSSPQGWSPRDSSRRPDSPLLKWRIPSAHDSNVDMKAHLKFWAHSVASTVSAEC